MTETEFMTFEEAVEILYGAASPQTPREEVAHLVVHDWLVNVAFDGTEETIDG